MSPIERSAGGGGAGGGLTKLFDSTLLVDTATIDTGANGIAGGFSAIEIVCVFRTDEAAAVSNCLLTFNGDGGLNYDVVAFQVNNTTVIGNQNTGIAFIPTIVHGSGGSASYPSSVVATIPNYTGTTFFKTGTFMSGQLDGAAANQWIINRQFAWRSTAAITQLTYTAQPAQKFKAGSRVTIYGLP